MTQEVSLRLDLALVARGLAPTRARARDLILRGLVEVDGQIAAKAGAGVAAGASLRVLTNEAFMASRGGLKLKAGLAHLGYDPSGRVALDVGASTGGFTELLLARGATKVYAVDVGRDQLHERLQGDERVVNLEGQDARSLDRAIIAEPIGVIVCDVSFISITKALPAALGLAAAGAFLVALVKPQFEVGRAGIGKGGIVRDPQAGEAAALAIADWLGGAMGWQVDGIVPSPILGGSGNTEFLLGARRGDG